MTKIIYSYDGGAKLTDEIIFWLDSNKGRNCATLKIGINAILEDRALRALLGAPEFYTIKRLQLEEIYLSPENFEKLLTLPNLIHLEISGGGSTEYTGAEYIFPTLSEKHFVVLATSPHAKRLQTLILNKETVLGMSESELQSALPNLKNFSVFNYRR